MNGSDVISPAAAGIVALSLAAVGAIGVWSLSHTRTASDFFVAGRRLGVIVASLATMSSAFSGFVFLGGPGLTYSIGAASLLIVAPVGFTSTLLCWTVAPRLRRLASRHDVMTVPDALAVRFRSRTTRAIAAIVIVFGSVGYLGAQLTALGIVFEQLLGASGATTRLGFPLGLLAGAAFLVCYSVAGGMMAGVYTDVLQGMLMMAAAVAVAVWLPTTLGGEHFSLETVTSSPRFGEDFLHPLRSAPLATGLGLLFLFGIGPLGQPHMLHKFFMLRDSASLRWMPLALGAGQSLCLLIWLGVGLAVPALVAAGALPALESPDSATPVLVLERAPGLLGGLVLAAVLAAVMSTADSFMNIGSAALVRDLPRAMGRPLAQELLWGRLSTFGITGAAALLAWAYDDLIALLGTFAFGTFAAGLAPAVVVGLAWKRAGAFAACASMLTGVTLNVGLELAGRLSLTRFLPAGVPAEGSVPAATALAAAFVVMIVLSTLMPAGRARSARNSGSTPTDG